MDFRKNIDTIIFDLDGTLHDLDIDWKSIKNKIGVVEGENLQTYIEKISDEERKKVYQILDEAEHDGFGDGFNKETIQQLEKLSEKFRLIIYSRNSEEVIRKFLSQASQVLAEKVRVVGRVNGAPIKPDTTELTRRYEITASTILIGDTAHDVEVAKALEIPCIIIKNDKNAFTPLGATIYVADLPAAIKIITEQ